MFDDKNWKLILQFDKHPQITRETCPGPIDFDVLAYAHKFHDYQYFILLNKFSAPQLATPLARDETRHARNGKLSQFSWDRAHNAGGREGLKGAVFYVQFACGNFH